MFIFKQSTANELVVGFFDDATGLGITGLIFSDVSVKLSKEGQVGSTSMTMSSSNWHEASDGWYRLKLAAGDCDTLGTLAAIVTLGSSGAKGNYPCQIVANTDADVMARLGVPVHASISADIAAVSTGGVDLSLIALQATLLAVKAKTDALPAAPADETLVIAATTGLMDAIVSRIGSPVSSAGLAADIAAIATSVTGVISTLAIIKGLMGANSFEDTFVYGGPSGALSSSRLRTYDTAANRATHGATGLLKTYTFTFGYTGADLTSVSIDES